MYEPLLRELTNSQNVEVKLISVAGCGFIPLHGSSGMAKPCLEAIAATARRLNAALRSGDVLFLPSLRTPRIVDQDGQPAPMRPVYGSADMKKATMQAVAFLKPLVDRGVRVVFEAPTPLFPAPAFRCSDWFNKMNPACRGGLQISRTSAEARRRPIILAMTQVAKSVPGVMIWDPMPILCSPSMCRAVEKGRPLFFDADHLSGHGTEVLAPAFLRQISPLLKK